MAKRVVSCLRRVWKEHSKCVLLRECDRENNFSSSVKSKRWLVNVRYVKFVDLNLYVAWSATLTYVNLEPVWIVIVIPLFCFPRMLHRQFYWKPNFFST